MTRRRLIAAIGAGLITASIALAQPVPADGQAYGEGLGGAGVEPGQRSGGGADPTATLVPQGSVTDSPARSNWVVARYLPNTGGVVEGPGLLALLAVAGAGLALGVRGLQLRRARQRSGER